MADALDEIYLSRHGVNQYLGNEGCLLTRHPSFFYTREEYMKIKKAVTLLFFVMMTIAVFVRQGVEDLGKILKVQAHGKAQ
jgi:hypothetical protein